MRFSHDMPTHRFTADDVMRMVDVGVLDEDAPVELIDGELIVMSPQGPRHAHTLLLLRSVLCQAYGALRVREEKPIRLNAYSLPEPDLCVTVRNGGAFVDAHPTAADCVLVMEAAHSSQRADRRKAALYAAGGVPEYWLVDLIDQTVTVYADPATDGYRLVRVHRDDEPIPLPGLDAMMTVDSILPR